MTFADFILQHEAEDPVRLLLSRDKYPGIDLDLAVTTLEVRRRLRTKVPEWYAVPSLVYPSRLSGEQCSSSETARYKAHLALMLGREGVLPQTVVSDDPSQSRLAPSSGPSLLCGRGWPQVCGGTPSCLNEEEQNGRGWPQVSGGTPSCLKVADLTGGMGVDAWAFAQVAGEVLYNEMQEDLARATELNFRELGVENVRFRNCKVEPGKVAEVLDGFAPDVIFLDPARRAEDGRKVFLIEECQPDVLGLLPELFAASRYVLLKLSPMADITMACKRLGEHVEEVHVVASGGECKELLFLLDREWVGTYTLTAYEQGYTMSLAPEDGKDSFASLGMTIEKPLGMTTEMPVGMTTEMPFGTMFGCHSEEVEDRGCHSEEVEDRRRNLSGRYYLLFEPGKALTKAGAFSLPCVRYGLTKLGHHTHLYVGEAVPEELRPFGKVYGILEVLPLSNRSLKETGKRYPRAEVTARNIPMTSDLLRKKLGCASGGDIHLFGVRVDTAREAGNYLIVTKKRYGTD